MVDYKLSGNITIDELTELLKNNPPPVKGQRWFIEFSESTILLRKGIYDVSGADPRNIHADGLEDCLRTILDDKPPISTLTPIQKARKERVLNSLPKPLTKTMMDAIIQAEKEDGIVKAKDKTEEALISRGVILGYVNALGAEIEYLYPFVEFHEDVYDRGYVYWKEQPLKWHDIGFIPYSCRMGLAWWDDITFAIWELNQLEMSKVK